MQQMRIAIHYFLKILACSVYTLVYKLDMPIKIIIYCLYIYRFAAFFLSAFPNTTDYKIPQGVLQGTACFQCQHDCKHDSVIKLYY